MVIPTVYLAAPWADRAKAREVRDQLVAANIRVNSRWLDLHHEDEDDVTDAIKAEEAMHDIEDVLFSDMLVLWNSMKSEGKAVETGVALTSFKGIVIIGERTNVFHYLNMPVVKTVEEAIEVIKNYPWLPGQGPMEPEQAVAEDPAAKIVLADR